MENTMEAAVVYWGYIGSNGKYNGHSYSILSNLINVVHLYRIEDSTSWGDQMLPAPPCFFTQVTHLCHVAAAPPSSSSCKAAGAQLSLSSPL